MSAGLEGGQPNPQELWFLSSKLTCIHLPFTISLHQSTYRKQLPENETFYSSVSWRKHYHTLCQQEHTKHAPQNALYRVQKQSYLNNLPLSLVSWSSLKRVIWQHFSPFMGKKKGERKSARSERAGLRCHTHAEAPGCGAPRRAHPSSAQ